MDDHACHGQLRAVQDRFVRLERQATARGDAAAVAALAALDLELLECEDAALTFWKYLRRTREPFLVRLHAMRAQLDEVERALWAPG